MSIEEDYPIVDRGGAAYVGDLVHGLKPPVSIHAYRWCVVEYTVQWYVDGDLGRTPWLGEKLR